MNRKATLRDPRLPKASLVCFQFLTFWFADTWRDLKDPWKRRYWKARIWLPTRYANAFGIYIGPLHIIWRRPWLAGPAKAELERLERIEAFNKQEPIQ